MIRIGSYSLPTTIVLAPLSGWAELSFRLLVRSYGARFCFYEMADANALLHHHPETMRLLKHHPDDTPIAAQLLGHDPVQLVDAAQLLLAHTPVPFLDVNCACPVKKVLKKKSGAWLLKEPERIAAIVKKLSTSLSIPITVKLRTGFSTYDVTAFKRLASECEAAGAQAIFIHGRTREQAYSGPINYDAIRAVKHVVHVPVFGSGNIFSPVLAKHMLDQTGCDGVLVARGAFGNPWIFHDIEQYLAHGHAPEMRTMQVRTSALKKHLSYIDQYNEYRGTGKLGYMRKIAQWYVKDFPQACKLRHAITSTGSYEALLNVIDTYTA